MTTTLMMISKVSLLSSLAAAIFGWSTLASADVKLKQLHVITRHGSRTPLAKSPTTLAEAGGARLTPLGEKQLYDLGTWLRATYNQADFLKYFDPSDVRLESSDLDRTVSSANSLSMGLFPLAERLVGNGGTALFTSVLPDPPAIPVYSLKSQNDVYLRAFLTCPEFLTRLDRLYQSDQWQILQENSRNMLLKMAQIFPPTQETMQDYTMDGEDEVLLLEALWTYYDLINVARVECNPDPTVTACTTLENPDLRNALTEDEYAALKAITENAELMKYGIGTAGNLLGSNLLWEILQRTTGDGKFFLYSAHAATMLGLLGSIREFAIEESFPDYSSAIIVEVYEDVLRQFYTVRFMYKPGSSSVSYRIPLKQANCDTVQKTSIGTVVVNATDHCMFTDFLAWVAPITLYDVKDWCKACGNRDADICMATELNSTLISQGVKELEMMLKNSGKDPAIIAGTFFGGFAAGMLMFWLFYCLCCRSSARRETEKMSTEVPPESATQEQQDVSHDLHLNTNDDSQPSTEELRPSTDADGVAKPIN